MDKRYCVNCRTDISSKPKTHYLCYSCWKKENEVHSKSTFSFYDENDEPTRSYNETYEQRYKGDSEYDLGPDWDYDEYPPENL